MATRRKSRFFFRYYNEEPNLEAASRRSSISRSGKLGRSAEIIYVDDGSTDASLTVLREIAGP